MTAVFRVVRHIDCKDIFTVMRMTRKEQKKAGSSPQHRPSDRRKDPEPPAEGYLLSPVDNGAGEPASSGRV